jgi:iron complex transport system substrate-binding protein
MTGHPKSRRASAGLNLPLQGRRLIPLLSVAVLLALVLLVSAGLLVAGCGSDSSTTTAAPATTASATASAETATTAASGGTTISAAPKASEGTFPVTITDDNGVTLTISAKPVRIVSTKPASTEILFAIGAGDRVVGVSSLDDYPPEAASIAKVGEFQPNPEAIMGLSPDLVISYSGYEEQMDPLAAEGAPVVTFNPSTVDGIYAAGSAPKVFYAVDNTLWTVGPGTFLDDMLMLANAVNVGAMQGTDGGAQQYYQFAAEQLIAADPDVILLPNTAFKSVEEFTGDARFSGLTAVKDGRVYLVNDTIITRPGPRIAEGFKALVLAVHPDAGL